MARETWRRSPGRERIPEVRQIIVFVRLREPLIRVARAAGVRRICGFVFQGSLTRVAKPFNVAFIGAGGIARTHMKYLKTLENVSISAAADPSEMSLARLKQDYPDVPQFTDYKKMLKEAKCDAVDVCTPNGLHAENCIAGARGRQGRHRREADGDERARKRSTMLDAAKRAGKKIIVGFQHRFDPKTKLIRDQIAADSFGKILYVRAQALRRRGIPNWGVFGRKELQGGGPMIDIGVHILETAHYMIGSPRPVSASGNAWTYMGNKPSATSRRCGRQWDHRTYNVEDLAVGMIRFDNGAVLVIESLVRRAHREGHFQRHADGREGRGRSGTPARSSPTTAATR